MRVFVTGGTGFVGSAVVRDLLAAGHAVIALARSETSAAALSDAGAEPHPGSLQDVERLRAGAARADAVIHTAFDNSDPRRFPLNARRERSALEAFGDVLAGSGRPMVAAGGFAPVPSTGSVLTERDVAGSRAGLAGRNVERTVMALADRGVNASVVRLPCVHGEGDHFTLPHLIDLARKRGRAAYVGDGSNRIPAVHNLDAARVFRLAVERGVTGSRYHAVAEEGVAYKDVAETLGRRLALPTVSLTPLRARWHFGVYFGYARRDAPASSPLTREQLGWEPHGPTLLADLDRAEYFHR